MFQLSILLNKRISSSILSDVILKLGEGLKKFEKYTIEASADKCLEIEEDKITVSDNDLREKIKQHFGVKAIEVSNETREMQDTIIKKMKEINGVSIRQIARVTGLSQSRVWRA